MLANIGVQNNINFTSSFYERFFKSLPAKEIKNTAEFNKIGKALASPHYNRAALGLGAIITQPAIDRYNPNVDNNTALASSYRTTGKIIACSSVGFCVRGGCYKITDKFANASKEEGSTILTPKAILKETNPELRKNMLKLHKNAFSTVFALAVMVFTNFLIDAPLTTFISNYLIKRDKRLTPQKEAA